MIEERYAVSRKVLDESETTDKCIHLVQMLINAMNWSPESEKMAIEAVENLHSDVLLIAENAIRERLGL